MEMEQNGEGEGGQTVLTDQH